MKLYLVRHGEAAPSIKNPKRPLTDQGKKEVRQIGVYLKERAVRAQRIWHSPKQRAVETAEALAAVLDCQGVLEQRDDLKPEDAVPPILDLIHTLSLEGGLGHLMIVSHVPFLPTLASDLLKQAEGPRHANFPEAGVACLELKGPDRWELAWSVSPAIL